MSMGGPARSPLDSQDLVDDADYVASQSITSSSAFIAPLQEMQQGPKTRNGGGELSVSLEDVDVVFIKDNVAVHPTQNASQRINGRLRLLKQGPSLFLTWIPYAQRTANGEASDSAAVAGYNSKLGVPTERDRHLYTIRPISLAEVRSIRRHAPPLGWQYIIIVLTTGLAFPPLYFHNGGIREFLGTLKEHIHIVRSMDDANLFLINDIGQDPLQRSLTSLELRDVVSTAALSVKEQPLSAESSSNHKQIMETDCSELVVPMIQSKEKSNSEQHGGRSVSNLDGSEYYRQKSREPTRDISIHVLEKFSLVTKFARDTTAQLFGESRLLGSTEELDHIYGSRKLDERKRPFVEETKPLSLEQVGNSDELTKVDSTVISDERFQIDSTNVGGRLPELSHEEWVTFLDCEGRIMEPQDLKKRIFYGNLEPGVRSEVWKFVLGHFPFNSTYKEREELVARKRVAYRVLKAQWETISDEQAKRFTKFRERKNRIEKDVVRTDRGLQFYADDDSPNLTTLRDILITYSFYNFDLGYCQGMSDLLSPIVYVVRDESESFWCFASLMEHLAPNFHRDQNGMHSQLLALSKLVELLDNPLHVYFTQADCLNYFFCFRWILIQFKREFQYENVIRLWEVLWTNYLSEHLHLYICVALLKRHRQKIIQEQMDFDTLLKFINELSGHIDLEQTLKDAEALFKVAGTNGTACIPPGTPPALQVQTDGV